MSRPRMVAMEFHSPPAVPVCFCVGLGPTPRLLLLKTEARISFELACCGCGEQDAAFAILARRDVHNIEGVLHADNLTLQLMPARGVPGKCILGRKVAIIALIRRKSFVSHVHRVQTSSPDSTPTFVCE